MRLATLGVLGLVVAAFAVYVLEAEPRGTSGFATRSVTSTSSSGTPRTTSSSRSSSPR